LFLHQPRSGAGGIAAVLNQRSIPRSAFQTRKPPRAGRPAWKCADEFRRWLRKLPCACCNHIRTDENPIVAAHVDHAGGKGVSTKVADRHSLPLCDECHKRQHLVGWLTFEKSLPLRDAVALAGVYWTEWPGRRDWEREMGEGGR
jgi:hypothetical protein